MGTKTCGRPKGRNIKASRRKNEENKFDNPDSLTLSDVQCTVCMGIFIEPVTLPCFHTVCKLCFEKTIDNNTLSCPLCRKYVGGWVRQRQKNGLMVNQTLWGFISQHFQTHVQKKLRGEDDEDIDGTLLELWSFLDHFNNAANKSLGVIVCVCDVKTL